MAKISKICKYCSGVYEVYPYRESETKYCSLRCAYKNNQDKITEARNAVRKGKPLPESTRRKQSIALKKFVASGRHHLWKGGIAHLNDTERHTHMATFEYRNWRKLVFERDKYICQICGKTNTELNAHHIMGYAEHEQTRLDIANGITLCKKCHISVHKDKVHGLDSDEILDRIKDKLNDR